MKFQKDAHDFLRQYSTGIRFSGTPEDLPQNENRVL
jgi:hypothetical protein